MKAFLAVSAGVAAVMLAAPAFAEINVSLGYSDFDIGSKNVSAATARVGWQPGDPATSDYILGLGVEAEASIGLGTDASGTGTSRIGTKLTTEYGGFGVLAATGDVGSIFVRAGYGNIDTKTTVGTGTTATTISSNEGGPAYGAGGSLSFGDHYAFRVEYTYYDVNLGAAPAAGSTPAIKGRDASVYSLSFVRLFK